MAKVRKAVIPAAGLGTRVLPITKVMPKEMLPIVDKPAIQYIVEEAVRSGIEDILIITNRGKGLIEDHFDHAPELEQRLEATGKRDMLREIQSISHLANICFIRAVWAMPSAARGPLSVMNLSLSCMVMMSFWAKIPSAASCAGPMKNTAEAWLG